MAIHIKPENRGKFTATKKKTGKSTGQLLHSKNALTRRRANFARMAKRHWKKLLEGGFLPIYQDGGISPVPLPFDLGSLFSSANNLTPSTTNLASGPSMLGGGMGLDDALGAIGMGAKTGMAIMKPIMDAIGKTKNMQMQSLYSNAMEDLRPVDENAIGDANTKFLGLLSRPQGRKQARIFNEGIAKKRFNLDVSNRLSAVSQSPNYTPVARQGGFIAYKGETHDTSPTGGILVDNLGNPVDITEGQAVASVEGGGKKKAGEVSWYNPLDKSTYIYSDKNGDAEPMRKLIKQFKLDKPLSQYKTDSLVQAMVDQKAKNIKTAAEFAKEVKMPYKNAEPMFAKGGTLTAHKAGEILRDGTVHGHKLTAKQKRFFGWVRGGRKADGGPLDTVRNNVYTPLTDLNINAELQKKGFLSDTLSNITPQMRVNAILAHPDSGFAVSKGRPTANMMGINYWGVSDTSPHINAKVPFRSNEAYNKTTPITEPFKVGGYIKKRKHPAVFPFLPIPEAPVGAYTEELGGYIPLFDSGGNLAELRKKPGGSNAGKYKGVHSFAGPSGGAPKGTYPINTLKRGRAALAYAHNAPNPSGIRSAVYRKYPQLKHEEGGFIPMYQEGGPPESRWMQKFRSRYNTLTGGKGSLLGQLFSPLGGSDVYPGGWSPGKPSDIPTQQDIIDRLHKGSYSAEDAYQFVLPGQSGEPIQPTLDIPAGHPLYAPKSPPLTTIPGEGRKRGAPTYLSTAPISQFLPNTTRPGLQKSHIPLPSTNTTEEAYNPQLSPLGHLLSGAGSIADYMAMRRNKPTPVSLPRVGAEKISLAPERLTAERQAAASRAINAGTARGMGLNAGAATANTTAANTGVNRLLSESRIKSSLAEETTNAQLRQQANMVNAELAAQEEFFNKEQSNAYNALLARINPAGALSRTAASYFADNAAYGRGFDMMKLIAPDYELYNTPGTTKLKKFLGRGPGLRARKT